MRAVVVRVLTEAPFSLQEVARQTGISYGALWAWATGHRNPKRASLEKLAEYLEGHGKRLQDFAEELRAAMDAPDD